MKLVTTPSLPRHPSSSEEGSYIFARLHPGFRRGSTVMTSLKYVPAVTL
jgi:hypothetical protein